MQVGQYGVCVCAYPVVCARGSVRRIRVRAIVCEGKVISYIKDEAIRNYEWYGPSMLPSVYNVANAEREYLFRDDGVLYYVSHVSVRILCIVYDVCHKL